MMRALLLCLVLAATTLAQAAPRTAGSFKLAAGEVLLQGKDGSARPAAVGGKVFEGDSITTQAGAEAHLQMADGASLIVRENSRITVAAYVADGGANDRSLIELARGALRSITGWIGRHNRSNYAIRTPLVTIGVRGTDHEPLVIPAGSTEGEPGSYDRVNVGSSYIRTQHGSVDVKPNQAGFAPLRGRPVPRVLPQVPAFFKATRHEAAIAARHEVVRKAIDQRRDDRRKVLQEKKTQLDKQKAERQKAVQERKREQDAQRLKQREERNRQLQDNRQRRQQESGLQQRNERERRSADAGDRRQRLDERRQARPQDREMRDRDRPRRNADGNHAPRGGGRGRD